MPISGRSLEMKVVPTSYRNKYNIVVNILFYTKSQSLQWHADNLEHTVRFWNNPRQVRSKPKD
jgi:hypothetical protein